jgi:hypothetical protein
MIPPEATAKGKGLEQKETNSRAEEPQSARRKGKKKLEARIERIGTD